MIQPRRIVDRLNRIKKCVCLHTSAFDLVALPSRAWLHLSALNHRNALSFYAVNAFLKKPKQNKTSPAVASEL